MIDASTTLHDQPTKSVGEAVTNNKVRFSDFGKAGPAGLVAATLPLVGGFALMGLTPTIAPWLRDLGPLGLLIYIAVFAITSGLAILPSFAQAALGGYAFGMTLGLPGALAGLVGGALVGYFATRKITGDDGAKGFKKHPKWNIVLNAFFPDRQDDGNNRGFLRTFGFIALIRIPSTPPFALTNIALSSIKVDVIPYALGTLVGMLPRTTLICYLGSIIQGELSKDITLKSNRPDWFMPVGIGVTLVVLVVLTRIGNLAIKKAVASGELKKTKG